MQKIKINKKVAKIEMNIRWFHKAKKKSKINNRYNQEPHLTQDNVRESDNNTSKYHLQES